MDKKTLLLDPDNMPGLDYYLEPLRNKGNSYPDKPNHSGDLTIEGFCNAANALIEPFGNALEAARKINSARF
ncbi:hypothetical protein R83H12_00398 [Fibrobacteria bacterium R8-3-H12]